MALSLQRYTCSFSPSLDHILKERSLCRTEKEQERLVTEIKVGDVLPENVIVEILSWLPVKVLLQFKCVCKSWYHVISSPVFTSKHMKNYFNKEKSYNGCLLAQYYVPYAELQLFELYVDDTPIIVADEILYDMPMYGSHVCGPCDGIYYLYNYDDDERALWNPTINELKVLPSIITKPDHLSDLTYAQKEVYGFGYDSATKDYKVVVIKGYCIMSDGRSKAAHPLSVLVYSLRKDSWRYWGDLAQNYDLEQSKSYIVVNGCFYWLGSSAQCGNELIVSFDMGTDAVQELGIPDYDKPASKCLGIYEDSLAFLVVHKIEMRFDIWTLNRGLWTKKFTMGPILNIDRPVGHWKKNKVILECDYSRLVLCDPEKQEMKDLAFQKEYWCQGVFVYQESLLSLGGRNR